MKRTLELKNAYGEVYETVTFVTKELSTENLVDYFVHVKDDELRLEFQKEMAHRFWSAAIHGWIINKDAVKIALQNREHTRHGMYSDIGHALRNCETRELVEYVIRELHDDASLKDFLEERIIASEISKDKKLKEHR